MMIVMAKRNRYKRLKSLRSPRTATCRTAKASLLAVKKLFLFLYRISKKGKALVDRNMPAMTGQLKWATELKAKMSFSVKSFKDLNHPICYKEGAKAVFRKYKEMMGLLSTFEDKVFEDWNQSITKKISQSLSRSLILRDENRGILRVNFGRDLGSILREVSCNILKA